MEALVPDDLRPFLIPSMLAAITLIAIRLLGEAVIRSRKRLRRRLERSPIAGVLARHQTLTWVFAGQFGAMAWQTFYMPRFFMADLVTQLGLSAFQVYLVVSIGVAAGIFAGFPLGMVRSRKLTSIGLAAPAPLTFWAAALALPGNALAGLAALLIGAFCTGAVTLLLWDHIQTRAGRRSGQATAVSAIVWSFALFGLGAGQRLLAQRYGEDVLLLVVAGLMLVLPPLIWLFVESDERTRTERLTGEVWLGVGRVLRERKTLYVFLACFLCHAAYGTWAYTLALRIGPGRGWVPVIITGITVALGGFVALAMGWMWDKAPRAALALSLVIVAAGSAAAVLRGDSDGGLVVAGILSEGGSTAVTAGAGTLSKWMGDLRDIQRSIAVNMGRALGPVLPLGIGVARLDADTQRLTDSQWVSAHMWWIPVLLLAAVFALVSPTMNEIRWHIVTRGLTPTQRANRVLRRLRLQLRDELVLAPGAAAIPAILVSTDGAVPTWSRVRPARERLRRFVDARIEAHQEERA